MNNLAVTLLFYFFSYAIGYCYFACWTTVVGEEILNHNLLIC